MTTTKPPPYPEGHQLLAGKNVLITAGAGAGIGFAAAKRCVEEGARVFVSDIHPERTAQAAAALSELSEREVGHFLCNVTQEDDVQALVAAAQEDLGSVDVLINNAGLGGTCDLVDMEDVVNK